MGKEEILTILESDIRDPGSYKSGEYLEEHAMRHASNIVEIDRQGLVEALIEWINTKTEPRTMLAVRIAQQLKLAELMNPIRMLRNEIADWHVFPSFYLRYIDEALEGMNDKK